MTDRRASTTWTGDLAGGRGTVTLESSGADKFDVSWPSRSEDPNGLTSPEELIAAAHSSCYSMQLSHMIGEAGGTPNQINTTAVVTLIVGEGITKIALTCRASVDGMDEAAFQQTVQGAKEQCPVSGLVKANTEITLDALLV
jgi:lipoyl-dependent peroxiredoxin